MLLYVHELCMHVLNGEGSALKKSNAHVARFNGTLIKMHIIYTSYSESQGYTAVTLV